MHCQTQQQQDWCDVCIWREIHMYFIILYVKVLSTCLHGYLSPNQIWKNKYKTQGHGVLSRRHVISKLNFDWPLEVRELEDFDFECHWTKVS